LILAGDAGGDLHIASNERNSRTDAFHDGTLILNGVRADSSSPVAKCLLILALKTVPDEGE